MDIKITGSVGKYTINNSIVNKEFYYCLSCEHTVKEDQKFCHNCGKELTWRQHNRTA